MIHHRSAQEVKWFDIIKLIILIILIILLLLNWFWFSGPPASTKQSGDNSPATVAAQVNPTATKPPATKAPATHTPTPTRPALAVPTLDIPSGLLTPGEITLTGTGTPGSQVAVVVDGKPAGTAAVGADGTWSLPIELTEAKDYEVSAQALDANGKVAAESEKITLTVAAPPTATPTAKPPTPTPTAMPITAPTLNAPGGDILAGKVTLTGTGEPGSQIEIVVDGKVVGTATVGKDGKWSFEADFPKPGDYEVSVQSVDAEGKVLAASQPLTLSVTKPVVAPTLDAPGDSLTAGKVTLTGTGESGSQIEIVVDGKVVGTATVGKDGQWSFEADLPEAGEYEVSVQSVDAEGKVLALSKPLTLSIAEAVAPPVLDKPKGELTAGKVELSGAGEPGSQVVILIDGQEAGQATVGADGTWSFTPNLDEAGDYEVQVQTVDENGQVVAESEAGQVTVAKAPVVAPTLDRPRGSLTAGPVELSGRGEPNSEVVIVIDGQEAGQAKVDAQGRWNFTADFPQAGEYEVNIQALDDKGQVLAESGGTRLAIAAPTTPCSEIYTVQKDDWLTKLALKYYNEMFDYPLIVEATNAKAQEDSTFLPIPNPDLIEIGQQLCIPEKP